jgi:hypothetical protein
MTWFSAALLLAWSLLAAPSATAADATVECPALPQCAAPPPFCTWTGPSTDANGCLIGCGSLLCDPIDSLCSTPPPACAAPPVGCSYPNPEVDANGCLISCGNLFCCPALSCMAPEPGCFYDNTQPTLDPQGCPTSCGLILCDGGDPLPPPPPPPLPTEVSACPVCSNPCELVQCALGKKCQVKKPRKKKDRNGCKKCATETKCVRRRLR